MKCSSEVVICKLRKELEVYFTHYEAMLNLCRILESLELVKFLFEVYEESR